MADRSNDTHACPSCGEPTPNERQRILGTPLCIKCSPQAPKKLGIPEYGHKAGGVTVVCDTPEEFEFLKKPANQRR